MTRCQRLPFFSCHVLAYSDVERVYRSQLQSGCCSMTEYEQSLPRKQASLTTHLCRLTMQANVSSRLIGHNAGLFMCPGRFHGPMLAYSCVQAGSSEPRWLIHVSRPVPRSHAGWFMCPELFHAATQSLFLQELQTTVVVRELLHTEDIMHWITFLVIQIIQLLGILPLSGFEAVRPALRPSPRLHRGRNNCFVDIKIYYREQ